MPNYVYHLVVDERRKRFFFVYNCYKSCLFLPPLTVAQMKPHLLQLLNCHCSLQMFFSVSSKGCGDLADEGIGGSSNSGEVQGAKRATHGK